MKSQEEIEQCRRDLKLVEERMKVTRNVLGGFCVNAALGAIEWVLGIDDGGGPASVIAELRSIVRAEKAKEN